VRLIDEILLGVSKTCDLVIAAVHEKWYKYFWECLLYVTDIRCPSKLFYHVFHVLRNQTFTNNIARTAQWDVILIQMSWTEIFTDSGNEAERALNYEYVNK
jgi:hypothetical protein